MSRYPFRFVALLAVLLAGLSVACSYTFDHEAQDIPLVGQPLNAATLLRLPRLTLGSTNLPRSLEGKVQIPRVDLLRGQDEAPWLLWRGEDLGLHLQRLQAPYAQSSYSASHWLVESASGTLILISPAASPTEPPYLRLVPLGGEPISVALPVGDTAFRLSTDVVLSWPELTDPFELHLLLRNSDSSLQRFSLPWQGSPPYGWHLDRERHLIFLLTWDSKVLLLDTVTGNTVGKIKSWFLRADEVLYVSAQHELHAYSSALHEDQFLGIRFPAIGKVYPDPKRSMFIHCSEEGLQLAEIMAPGTPAVLRQLTTMACDGLIGIDSDSESVRFFAEGKLYAIPLDGSRPPQLLPSVTPDSPYSSDGTAEPPQTVQPLASCDDKVQVFARKSPEPNDWGTSDGWIGDWQFMQRGLQVTFSKDCERVRWKEYAARPDQIGELLSATIPRGPVLRLARNVYWYEPLPDGRVLSSANMTLLGAQNRVVLIDEARSEANFLLEGEIWPTAMYPLGVSFPGSNDVLLEVYGQDDIPDLLLVPLPPRQP